MRRTIALTVLLLVTALAAGVVSYDRGFDAGVAAIAETVDEAAAAGDGQTVIRLVDTGRRTPSGALLVPLLVIGFLLITSPVRWSRWRRGYRSAPPWSRDPRGDVVGPTEAREPRSAWPDADPDHGVRDVT